MSKQVAFAAVMDPPRLHQILLFVISLSLEKDVGLFFFFFASKGERMMGLASVL